MIFINIQVLSVIIAARTWVSGIHSYLSNSHIPYLKVNSVLENHMPNAMTTQAGQRCFQRLYHFWQFGDIHFLFYCGRVDSDIGIRLLC